MTATTTPDGQTGGASQGWRFGLSSRVLALMIVIVMLAQVAVYLPSIAGFRASWINDRLSSAFIAALVLEAAPADMIPEELSRQLLENVGAKTIVIKIHNARRLLAISDMPPAIDESYDARTAGAFDSIAAALRTLLAPPGRMINVVGAAPMGGDFIEIVMDETRLQEAMRRNSAYVFAVSLAISLLVGAAAVAALHLAVLRPVARLTSNIMHFEQNPEDVGRIIVPSGRRHEIGRAEEALRSMQVALVRELNQKKHLAALGLAVAKINHDLRNMLATAQLLTDRLASAADPLTQRLAPKLVGTLDRAIRFCQSTLAYGRAVDEPPQVKRLQLQFLADEAIAAVAPFGRGGARPFRFLNEVPAGFELRADAEQMFRVLVNLLRNAAEALESAGTGDGTAPFVAVRARRGPEKLAVIEVADNGPGVPQAVRDRLFAAFMGSGRPGGSGLGLAIAADLVQAHGGRIELLHLPAGSSGATFRITMPGYREPRRS